jgi:hypothetical protein
MMATANEAFQWIINSAAGMSIDGRGTVAQTATRENVVRSVSRGGRVWRFTVTPSPGKTYTESRPYLAKLDQMDRLVTADITLNNPGFEQLNGYQGGGTGPFSVVVGSGTGVVTVTITANTLGAGEYVCRAGDWLQIGTSGSVYQVVEDPSTGNGATVTLNRPVDEAAGTYTGFFGANVTWTVICVERPTWSLVPAGANMLVQWSGEFVFFEDRT